MGVKVQFFIQLEKLDLNQIYLTALSDKGDQNNGMYLQSVIAQSATLHQKYATLHS